MFLWSSPERDMPMLCLGCTLYVKPNNRIYGELILRAPGRGVGTRTTLNRRARCMTCVGEISDSHWERCLGSFVELPSPDDQDFHAGVKLQFLKMNKRLANARNGVCVRARLIRVPAGSLGQLSHLQKEWIGWVTGVSVEVPKVSICPRRSRV